MTIRAKVSTRVGSLRPQSDQSGLSVFDRTRGRRPAYMAAGADGGFDHAAEGSGGNPRRRAQRTRAHGAGKRHRGGDELRPPARQCNGSVGGRRRPSDAFIHHASRGLSACSGRDLLHLAARPPGAARGARPLPRAAIRPAILGRAFLRHRLRHAVDPDRARDGARKRRRGHHPDADLAQRGRGKRRPRSARHRSADEPRECRLDARPRAARACGRTAHARIVHGVPVQSDRLDRVAGGLARDARAGAPARPVDCRGRDLCAVLVRRGRARLPTST